MNAITLDTPDGIRYLVGGDVAMMSKHVRTSIGRMGMKGATEFNLDGEQWTRLQRTCGGLYKLSETLPAAAPQGVRMATDAQLRYLNVLRVRSEPNMTFARASELIDAAKSGYLGSVGGWYTDGSN